MSPSDKNADMTVMVSSELISDVLQRYFQEHMFKVPMHIVESQPTTQGYVFSIAFDVPEKAQVAYRPLQPYQMPQPALAQMYTQTMTPLQSQQMPDQHQVQAPLSQCDIAAMLATYEEQLLHGGSNGEG